MNLNATLLIIAILVATATWNWRISVSGLGFHYLAMSLLAGQMVGLQVGFGYFVAGLSVTAILWLSVSKLPVRQKSVRPKALASNGDNIRVFPDSLSDGPRSTREGIGRSTGYEPNSSPFFQITVVGLCIVGALGLAENFPLIGAAAGASSLDFPWYLLVLAGAFATALTRHPLGQGIGLLLLLSGMQFAYLLWTAASQPNVLTLVAFSQVVLALLISRLTQGWQRAARESHTRPAGESD